ncbi:hypothetical protein T484DRAFT_1907346, partial [Baffinella frigidus]
MDYDYEFEVSTGTERRTAGGLVYRVSPTSTPDISALKKRVESQGAAHRTRFAETVREEQHRQDRCAPPHPPAALAPFGWINASLALPAPRGGGGGERGGAERGAERGGKRGGERGGGERGGGERGGGGGLPQNTGGAPPAVPPTMPLSTRAVTGGGWAAGERQEDHSRQEVRRPQTARRATQAVGDDVAPPPSARRPLSARVPSTGVSGGGGFASAGRVLVGAHNAAHRASSHLELDVEGSKGSKGTPGGGGVPGAFGKASKTMVEMNAAHNRASHQLTEGSGEAGVELRGKLALAE